MRFSGTENHKCNGKRSKLDICFAGMMNYSNITNDGNSAKDPLGEHFYITGFLLVTLAFTTNFLVSIVLSTRRKLREQTYTFLVMNLSIADLVVLSSVLTKMIAYRFFPNIFVYVRNWIFAVLAGTFYVGIFYIRYFLELLRRGR